MPKFRTKVREITAEQFRSGAALPNGVCLCAKQAMGPHVHTMHDSQQVELADGDWVVPEPNGKNYYPVKNDIMLRNYDRIEEE